MSAYHRFWSTLLTACAVAALAIPADAAAVVPANNDLANATALTGTSASATGSNIDATPEASEVGASCITTSDNGSVWWSYTAPADGVLTVDLTGSTFDTVLSLWTGTGHPLTEVACDDQSGTTANSSKLTDVPVSGGTTYYIRASGYGDSDGEIALQLDFAAGPPNDDLADAGVLTGISASATGSNVYATLEASEAAQTCGGSLVPSVWWSYTAPADGLLTVDLTGSAFDTVLSLWTGTAHPLAETACNDDGSGLQSKLTAVPVTDGTTYWIRVNEYNGGSSGDIALQLDFDGPPPNDDLADAAVLTGTSASATGSNVNATSEASEAEASCVGANPGSAWWTYTAPADGLLTVDLTGSTFDTVLSLWTGTAHPLTETACNDDFSDGQSKLTAVPVTYGTTYHIRVSGLGTQSGDVVLQLDFDGSPPNDDLADATVLTGTSASATGFNVNATFEASEIEATCVGANPGSVWWRYTAPADGVLSVDLTGSTFDTVLSLWTGTTHPLNQTACNDDGSEAQSELPAVPVTAGTTYHIRVSGFGTQAGDITLQLDFDGSPPNDDLADATVLTGTSASATGFNVNATFEASEADASCVIVSPGSVWWTYTAPADGLLTVDLTGSTFDTVLSLWTGTAHPLTETACNDDFSDGQSKLTAVPVTYGTTYHIRVSGLGTQSGDVVLQLDFDGSPPNDDLADATVLTGTSASATGFNVNATSEASEVEASCVIVSPGSVWWRYTAPADGALTVDLTGSTFDTVLSLWTGTAHPLAETACNDDASGLQSKLTAVPVTGGTTYHIRVTGYDSADSGDIALEMTFVAEGVWRMVEGSGPENHFYGPPAPGYTVDHLATQNLVRGVPGFYPSANLTLWTTWDAATAQWSPSAGTGEVLELGRAFRWKLLDRDDKGDPAVSQSRSFPFALQTTLPPNTADVTVTLDTGGKFQNYLANPFGTPLDLTGIRSWPNGNDTRPGVHVWDPGASSWSLAPSVIGPWEMFRVRSRRPRASGAPRLLTIPASARVLSRPSPDGKPAAAATVPVLAFRLDGRRADGRPLADRMLRLTFADDARAAFDADEDTEKYQPVSTAYVAIGARAAGAGTLVGEDVRPFTDAAIGLALETYGAAPELVLSWDATTLPAGLPVALVDLATGAEVDVRTVSEYAFEAASRPAHAEVPETDHIDGSASEDRFVLRIGSALAVEEPVTAVALGVAPNPSSGGARVSFALPEAGPVLLAVYDVRGREVAMLAAGEMPAGRHEARLPGGLAAGVYVIRLEAAGAVHTRQAAVVR